MVYSKEKGMVAKRFMPPKQPKDELKDEPAASPRRRHDRRGARLGPR